MSEGEQQEQQHSRRFPYYCQCGKHGRSFAGHAPCCHRTFATPTAEDRHRDKHGQCLTDLSGLGMFLHERHQRGTDVWSFKVAS